MLPFQKESASAVQTSKQRPLLTVLIPPLYLLAEILLYVFLQSDGIRPLVTGLLFSLLLGGICIALPRLPGRLFFLVTVILALGWAIAQYVYHSVFGKLMWLSDLRYTSDGAVYFGTILQNSISPIACVLILLAAALILLLFFFWPVAKAHRRHVRNGCLTAGIALCALLLLRPGSHAEVLRTTEICQTEGYYGLVFFDFRHNVLQPLLPEDPQQRSEDIAAIDNLFLQRSPAQSNAMTGVFENRDLLIVLLEAVDDWMITPEETPTLYALQQDSIRFSEFYTPYYGTTRSINTQTCIDLGGYFPTDGRYFYDYLDNCFDHSLANRFKAQGYTAELFHHNWPDFYRRSELVPALGYDRYNSYVIDAGGDEQAAMNDCYLFDVPTVRSRFFREGPVLNFVVTQAAHLPYDYSDPLSQYAFRQHPDCYSAYSCEQEDCVRAKVRLVDDLFARMLEELEAEGRLEDTVILVLSDHYPYGYRDTEQLLAFSSAEDVLELEQTPCFLWAADLEPAVLDKTLNTADILPTLLNLFGIPAEYDYPGRDAFDPDYPGYAFFADGSWAADGGLYRCTRENGETCRTVLREPKHPFTEARLDAYTQAAQTFAEISNKILSTDYYRTFP